MITAEELVLEVDNTEESNSFKLGIVTDLFENETAKIQFDGEETPSEKQYAYLSSYIPTVGDRVLLGVLGGTYIILGKVNYNVSPDTEEEIDRYLFDLKKVIMKMGLSITGDTDITGNLSVSGDVTADSINLQGDLSVPGDIEANNASVSTLTATSSATVGNSYMQPNNIYSPNVRGSSVRCTSSFNHSGTQLAFFGGSLVQKQSVGTLKTNATQAEIINAYNEFVSAIAYYSLIRKY